MGTKIKKTVMKPPFNFVNSALEIPFYKAIFKDVVNVIRLKEQDEDQVGHQKYRRPYDGSSQGAFFVP